MVRMTGLRRCRSRLWWGGQRRPRYRLSLSLAQESDEVFARRYPVPETRYPDNTVVWHLKQDISELSSAPMKDTLM